MAHAPSKRSSVTDYVTERKGHRPRHHRSWTTPTLKPAATVTHAAVGTIRSRRRYRTCYTTPFLCSVKAPFLHPGLTTPGRRAQWPSREARSRAQPRAAAPSRRAWRARRALHLDGREHGATLGIAGPPPIRLPPSSETNATRYLYCRTDPPWRRVTP
jgi:hypothetical protein